MLKQLFKDTRHHANILLVVTKSQNCKSYLLPPIWILAFAVKLAGANPTWQSSTKRISNHFPSKIKTKFFNHKIYVQQKVSDKKIVIKVAKY